MHINTCARGHAHTHTHNEKRKRRVIVLLGEGVTKRAVSGPCSMFCHHVVTKCARGTKRVGCASNLTHIVTKVTLTWLMWQNNYGDKTCRSDKTCHNSSHKRSATNSYQCVQYICVTKQLYGCQYLGFLTCTQMLMPAIVYGGCTDTGRWSALVDLEKNPLPHQGTWTQVSIVPGFSIWHSTNQVPWPLHSNSIPYTVIVFKPGVGIKLAASSFNALKKKKYWKRMTLGFAGFYTDIIWMSTSG